LNCEEIKSSIAASLCWGLDETGRMHRESSTLLLWASQSGGGHSNNHVNNHVSNASCTQLGLVCTALFRRKKVVVGVSSEERLPGFEPGPTTFCVSMSKLYNISETQFFPF
jgi:hypothetical protein